MNRLAALSLLVSIVAAPAFAARQDAHTEIVDVKLGGRRDGHRFFDLDGDGRRDLVAVVRTPVLRAFPTLTGVPFLLADRTARERRWVEIAWNGAGGFAEDAHALIPVPTSARVFALADVLPDPGIEVVFFVRDGIVVVPTNPAARGVQGAEERRRFAGVPSLFDFPDAETLPEWTLVVRGKGPASDALVVPTPSGFRVLRPTADGAIAPREELSVLPIVTAASSANRSFSVSKEMPRPCLRDLDGDGRLDLFFSDPSGAPQLIAYLGLANGRFAETPVVRGAPALRRELKSDLLTFETAEAIDLNGDGICDFVVSRTEGNIGLWDTLTTSQLVYFGRRGTAGFDTTPDQVVSSVGVSILPRAIDFDGDGGLDLLVSSYRTDLLTNIKNAVLNSARVTYFVFLMEKGRYPESATVERNVDLDFKVLERGGVAARAYFEGDFDGDGNKDLLAVEETELVHAYRGAPKPGSLLERPGYEFASEPMMTMALRAANDLAIDDLDGDGRSEVIFPEGRGLKIVRWKR